MKMTKNMNIAISSIYLNNSIKKINNSTLKALLNRNYLDTDLRITESGKVYVISRMSLIKQCSELSLNIENIEVSYKSKPELVALQYYKSQGFNGVNSEGLGVLTVLKALMLDELLKYEPFDGCPEYMMRSVVCTTYLESLLVNLNNNFNELATSIINVSRNRFKNNFEDILKYKDDDPDYKKLSIEFAISMYDALTKDNFISILRKVLEDPYTYRNGWCDLTLIKSNKLYFIEVKTSDKLHSSQLITIQAMRKIIPSYFGICKVKKII